MSAATVTFMHFNDLHAHLTPHLDKVVKDGQMVYETRGGLARLATLVKQIRAEAPASVLMNIGDTYHGGVEALYTNGNAIADPVNALGVDIGVPGNWDFAYGQSVFRLRYEALTADEQASLEADVGMTIKRPGFTILAANMFDETTGETILQATDLRDIGGVLVGFIGITSDFVGKQDKDWVEGWTFTDGETEHRDLINQQAAALRDQGAQLVVVMSELGIHKDYRLADVINSGAVDVFFSAHTHEATFTPLKGNSGALVVEAGNDGWLGRMDVTVESGTAPVFAWQLLPLGSDLAEDADMLALVDAERAPFLVDDPNLVVPMEAVTLALHQPITAVLGTVGAPLDRRQALESSFNIAYNDTARQMLGVEVAFDQGWRFDSVIPAAGTVYEDEHVADGALSVEDVYRFLPQPFSYATATSTVDNLIDTLDNRLTAVYSRDNFDQFGGWGLGIAGVKVTVDLTAPDDAKVQSMTRLDGTPLAGTDVLTVAGCRRPVETLSTTLCNYPGFDNLADVINPDTGNKLYFQELLIKAMQNGGLSSDGTVTNFTDVSDAPAWPDQQAVQPLMVQIADGVVLEKSALTYASKLWKGTVTITNTGSTTFPLPAKLMIDALSAGSVNNASGTANGVGFIALGVNLAPGESVTVNVEITGKKKTVPTYTPRLYVDGV